MHFSMTSMIVLFSVLLIDKPIVGKKLQMLEMVSTTMCVTLNHCHLASLAERDNERIIRCWNVFLQHFYAGCRTFLEGALAF